MYQQPIDSNELFRPDVGPLLKWPGLTRALVGCVGIATALLGMAFMLQQTIILQSNVSVFTPWFGFVLATGLIGIKSFAWVCFFPDDNRTLGQFGSNVLLVTLLYTAVCVLLVPAALSGGSVLLPVGSTFELLAGVFALKSTAFAAMGQFRLKFGKNLTDEQTERLLQQVSMWSENAGLGFGLLLLLRLFS